MARKNRLEQAMLKLRASGPMETMKRGYAVVMKNDATGLKNTSSTPWTVMLPDGSARVINKGEGMPAKPGLKVRFGQGEIGEFV